MKKLLCCIVGLSSIIGYSQEYWQTSKLDNKELISNKTHLEAQGKFYSLDVENIRQDLNTAPQRSFTTSTQGTSIYLPSVNGTLDEFIVYEASNFEETLQASFPQIRAYRGYQADNPNVTVSVSIGEQGLQTFKVNADGTSEFIETVTTDNELYAVFNKTSKSKFSDFECSTSADDLLTDRNFDPEDYQADESILRTFEIAISVTGEYTQYFGGTIEGALSAINATMARVNFLFERDMATNFEVIDETTDVIFLDPSTDPYGSIDGWNGELQTTLNSIIGFDNYDIGHLFGDTGGGGNAGCIGCICGPGKGSGYTSPADGIPSGDTFDIDYVAHEIGHQLGANHTFSRSEGTGVNVEPGSGSTIMGYAGITGGDTDVQSNSDDYFHHVSIEQIVTNLQTKGCADITDLSNNPPTANAGSDYTIPVSTPFILVGIGTDPDNDDLTFNWEQIDNSTSQSYIPVNPNATSGPLFRSLRPDESPVRFVPSFDDVLTGNLYQPFTALPAVAREINFAFQVRDNNQPIGQTNADTMQIDVIADQGAFELTSIGEDDNLVSGQPYTVTWNTAGTESAPFNSPTVNIYLSTDNGENFSLVGTGVDNNGSYTFDVPENSSTAAARILIESVGNIFYTVSRAFPIDFTAEVVCENFESINSNISIPDGNGSNSISYGGYAVASIPVSNRSELGDIRLNLDLSHTYVQDLQIVLIAPSSSERIKVWNHNCGSTDDIVASFSSVNSSALNCSALTSGEVFVPVESFTTNFENATPNGTWLVGVRDGYTQDTGTINSVSLDLCSTVLTPLSTSNVEGSLDVMQVYPNPSKGVFNINLTTGKNIDSISVYDAKGSLIKSNVSASKQVDLSGYPTGVYVLKTVVDGKTYSNKLVLD